MKRKLFTVFILVIIFQFLSCITIYRSVRDKRDRKYKEGVELYKQNNFAEAHDRFETVVDIEPDYNEEKQFWSHAL